MSEDLQPPSDITVSGGSSIYVVKSGSTMTGDLNMGSNAITNVASITLPSFSTAGIVHNNSSGVLSSSEIVNADISASAAIADTKLATISTAGKVSNAATTATSNNTNDAIVARSSNGSFAGTTITSDRFIVYNTANTDNQLELHRLNTTKKCNILYEINGYSSEVGLEASPDYDFYAKHRSSYLFKGDSSLNFRTNTVAPLTDNLKDIGSGSFRYKDCYLVNAATVGSSIELKRDIETSDLGLAFINSLNPVKYKFKDYTSTIKDIDGNDVDIQHTHTRYHYGLIAEEVKDVILDLNKTTADFAGYVEADSDSFGSVNGKLVMLRYEEFISPMIKAIQDLSAEVSTIEATLIANNIT